MERLFLARHGESVYSARGLANGDPGIAVGLTDAGAEQARALGRTLAGERLDLCVVTRLARTRLTAELALAELAAAGREVPLEELPALGDPRSGRFESRPLADYRGWAWSAPSDEPAPGGGESRREIVGRYVRGYHALLARPERTILAVAHALPIAYVLLALEGRPPVPRIDLRVEYAHPYAIGAAELGRALEVLEAWHAEPTW